MKADGTQNLGFGLIQVEASLDLLNEGRLQTPWWKEEYFSITPNSDSEFIANWPEADDCNGIQEYRLEVENLYTVSIDSSKIAYNFDGIDDGFYNAKIYAINTFNNLSNALETNFTVDNLPPNWEVLKLIYLRMKMYYKLTGNLL